MAEKQETVEYLLEHYLSERYHYTNLTEYGIREVIKDIIQAVDACARKEERVKVLEEAQKDLPNCGCDCCGYEYKYFDRLLAEAKPKEAKEG